jgi:hypothetical protein
MQRAAQDRPIVRSPNATTREEYRSMSIKLCVSPEAPVATPETIALKQQASSTGLRLGFLDNSKSNADHLLQFLLDLSKDKMPVETSSSAASRRHRVRPNRMSSRISRERRISS